MSTQQPKTLRLADALDCYEHEGMSKAAAELRRLHSVNADLLEAAEDAVNRITSQLKLMRCDDEFIANETQKLRFAIAKATTN
jgi:hypothetical protein